MVEPPTSSSEPHRCPVCDAEVTIESRDSTAQRFDFAAAANASSGETRCKRCQCELRLDHDSKLMIQMSKTSVQRIASELAEWRASGEQRSLLLDFEDVRFLGSEFLNELIVLQRQKRFRPVLCNLSPEIEEVFQITHLNRIFEIRPRPN